MSHFNLDTDALNEELASTRHSLKQIYQSLQDMTFAHQDQVQSKFLREHEEALQLLKRLQETVSDILEGIFEFSLLDKNTPAIIAELSCIQNQIQEQMNDNGDILVDLLKNKLSRATELFCSLGKSAEEI